VQLGEDAGRQPRPLIRVGVVLGGYHIGDPVRALPDGGHLGERATRAISGRAWRSLELSTASTL